MAGGVWRDEELLAARTAVAAGRLVAGRAGAAAQVGSKATPADLVTECDRQSEALIREALGRADPGAGVFGEEGGGDRDQERVWFVDPIDGTTNFVHGLPGFTVSIGLTFRGRPVAGAIYDPPGGELFTASEGGGATVNGRPIAVSPEPDMVRGLFATGFPPVDPYREYALACAQTVVRRSRNVRNLGSAALHLAYVASGRLTGFWEPLLNAWDVAAAVVIVREAGGEATDMDGRTWTADLRGVLGTNGRVHAALLETLRAVARPAAPAGAVPPAP